MIFETFQRSSGRHFDVSFFSEGGFARNHVSFLRITVSALMWGCARREALVLELAWHSVCMKQRARGNDFFDTSNDAITITYVTLLSKALGPLLCSSQYHNNKHHQRFMDCPSAHSVRPCVFDRIGRISGVDILCIVYLAPIFEPSTAKLANDSS